MGTEGNEENEENQEDVKMGLPLARGWPVAVAFVPCVP